MKTRLALLSLLACALVALMFTAAPVPRAAAFVEEHDHDPCQHTREHYGDDEDFQLWEQICEDTVRELRSRLATSEAICDSIVRHARRDVNRACRQHCRTCGEERGGHQGGSDCRRIPQRAISAVRMGQNRLSKCTWDAQKDYDAIYENTRTQLEDAGYTCLVQKLYVEYRYVQRTTIQAERRAYNRIERRLNRCDCDNADPS